MLVPLVFLLHSPSRTSHACFLCVGILSISSISSTMPPRMFLLVRAVFFVLSFDALPLRTVPALPVPLLSLPLPLLSCPSLTRSIFATIHVPGLAV